MVVTANGQVQTNEEAQVYVHDLGLFVTVRLLEDTPAFLSLGKLCEEHGHSYEWVSRQILFEFVLYIAIAGLVLIRSSREVHMDAAVPCKKEDEKVHLAHRKLERGLTCPTRFRKQCMVAWWNLLNPRGNVGGRWQ